MNVIYIDSSPLCRIGVKELLGGVLFFHKPSESILERIKEDPDLIIMDFPREIYSFEDYLRFINFLRYKYLSVKLLFFIDRTSPLISSLISEANPDAILNKSSSLKVIKETCISLIDQGHPANSCGLKKSKTAHITRGEIAVLCETARTWDVGITARRLNLNPKTVYSHLNNVGKKFGIRNRLELFKMMVLL